MRGHATPQSSMLTLRTPEHMVPQDHPLRRVKALADAALRELSPVFDAMYASTGRSSVPPEALLKGSLLMALYALVNRLPFGNVGRCETADRRGELTPTVRGGAAQVTGMRRSAT